MHGSALLRDLATLWFAPGPPGPFRSPQPGSVLLQACAKFVMQVHPPRRFGEARPEPVEGCAPNRWFSLRSRAAACVWVSEKNRLAATLASTTKRVTAGDPRGSVSHYRSAEFPANAVAIGPRRPEPRSWTALRLPPERLWLPLAGTAYDAWPETSAVPASLRLCLELRAGVSPTPFDMGHTAPVPAEC